MLKRNIRLMSVVILLVFVLGLVSCSKKSRITGISGTSALPEISNVSSGSITESSATIAWTTTTDADSLVEYGTSVGYGAYSTKSSNYITSHSVNLTGLTAGTVYHYRVISTDPNNNQVVSGNFTFITSGGGNPPPVISNVTATNITNTTATITWTTNVASTSQVEYGTTANYGVSTTIDTALVTSHSVNLSGLTAGTLYHYRVKSKDAGDNEGISGDNTFTTTSGSGGPVISNVASSGITQSGATITWTTDVGATSRVEYGTTLSYGTTTTLDTTLVTSHSVNLTGLSADTLYHYRVRSKNAGDNETIGTDNTFTTQSSGGGSGSVLYDFEDVSNPGWVNDTSQYFGECFGTPTLSTDYTHGGAKSLAVPFDLTELDPVWSCLNDALYVTSSFDFTHMSKLTIYMYVPASASSDITKAIEATVYMKTGGSWYWYESNELQKITPGTWAEVSIDFTNAKHDDSNKNLTVENLDDIKEIGVHLANGEGTSTTTFYIDDVTVE